MGFCLALAARRSDLSAGFARVCDELLSVGVSPGTSRATRCVHALDRPIPDFCPKLSAVSVSRAASVNRCCSRSFGRNLPGLASVREGNAKTLDCSPAPRYQPATPSCPTDQRAAIRRTVQWVVRLWLLPVAGFMAGDACLYGRSSKSPRRHSSCAVLRSLSRSPAAPTRWVCRKMISVERTLGS